MAIADNSTDHAPVKHHRVWDLPVRVFHWTLAFAFVGAFVTNRLGVNYFKYHVWCGYTVIVLVSFRVVWGIVGTYHARFASFVRGPIATLRYARNWLHGNEQPHAGHNPLGAWMVLILLAALFTQAFTGLFGNDEIFNVGPLYGYVSNDLSLQLTSLHRRLFYWIAAAIAVHVLAVIAHLIFKNENLVRAMITGRKLAHRDVAQPVVSSSRTWLAAILIGAFAATLAWIVIHAPTPADIGYE